MPHPPYTKIMRNVWIRQRRDGVTELSPEIAPLAPGKRWLVIGTAIITSAGLFVSGAIPAIVAVTVVASCLGGEVVLGAKALVLAVLRPPAEVYEVARWRVRHRAR